MGHHFNSPSNGHQGTCPIVIFIHCSITITVWAYDGDDLEMQSFNSLAPRKFEWQIRQVIFILILLIDGWGISCEIALRWMSHWTLGMVSQHWFRQWLGAIRQQSITLANVDPGQCHHMALLGQNELKNKNICSSCNIQCKLFTILYRYNKSEFWVEHAF